MRSCVLVVLSLGFATLVQGPVLAQPAPPPTNNLVLANGASLELSGIQRFANVCLTGGATLHVTTYDGGDKNNTGNLELIAGSIYIDSTSKIIARGAGYKAQKCYHGAGPNSLAGGRGGCAVMDSGGGGAHFGRGGRGTVDNPAVFDTHFEDNCDVCDVNGCSNTWDESRSTGSGMTLVQGYCTDTRGAMPVTSSFADCGTNFLPPGAPDTNADLCPDKPGTDTGRFCKLGPSVAGAPYWHNIYQPEFGAAGGDKGCRDGDGRTLVTGGNGGGRVVLVGLAERNANDVVSPCAAAFGGAPQGKVLIEGTIDTNGKRGCGVDNDSGGGGGGGSVLIVGGDVTVTDAAQVAAAGGLGGDTNAGDSAQPDSADCPVGSQTGGTCDDCGGGGGGGVISVLSVRSTLHAGAQFNVSGALGGVCTVCKGEAGGGAGELQLDGAYVDEYCDGFDNDFDGVVDENLGTQSCGLGSCAQTLAACNAGSPVSCSPMVDPNDASCEDAAESARPRVALILDTSASMLLDLQGYPTFGDGSDDHPGIDSLVDPDSLPNDSRLSLARESLAQVISAYPEIDFALARYHQDQGVNRSCQNAKWFECQGLVGTYDNPFGNTGTLSPPCTVKIGPGMSNTLGVNPIPGPDTPGGPANPQCINYAGSCGAPRRGADILSGFGTKVRDMVRWLDGRETNFSADVTTGNVCQHSDGTHDCEVRGSGPTPLAGSLLAIEDYVAPIRAVDSAVACRGYSVILLTDGAESCNGTPATAAQRLHDQLGIDVYVVAVSVLASEEASLNQIARAGSGNTRDAIFVSMPEQLVPALTGIIAGSIRFEKCNGMDDDCDGKTDEDFPGIGVACDDGDKGSCRGEGVIGCNAAENGTECKLTNNGSSMMTEICNSLDDDCDGKVDEALDCDDTPCTPTGGEVCNAVDDDCDDKVDESDPMLDHECGENRGVCMPGRQRCVAGKLVCVGATLPGMEICNGKDDDCDGEIDDEAPCPEGNRCIEGACRRACDPSVEFPCPVGYLCRPAPTGPGHFCVPGACALCKSTETCEDDKCVNPCESVQCEEHETCVLGSCKDCRQLGCSAGRVCYERSCQEDACRDVSCADNEFCFKGECLPRCDESQCGAAERCGPTGTCERDRCAGVTCDEGQVCRGGRCSTDPCLDLTCNLGDVCVDELGCIPDPCPVTRCPHGVSCAVGEQGQPICVGTLAPPPRPSRYVSGGGSGLSTCSVTRPTSRSDSAPYAAGGLLVSAFVWSLRRKRARRSSQSPRGL